MAVARALCICSSISVYFARKTGRPNMDVFFRLFFFLKEQCTFCKLHFVLFYGIPIFVWGSPYIFEGDFFLHRLDRCLPRLRFAFFFLKFVGFHHNIHLKRNEFWCFFIKLWLLPKDYHALSKLSFVHWYISHYFLRIFAYFGGRITFASTSSSLLW